MFQIPSSPYRLSLEPELHRFPGDYVGRSPLEDRGRGRDLAETGNRGPADVGADCVLRYDHGQVALVATDLEEGLKFNFSKRISDTPNCGKARRSKKVQTWTEQFQMKELRAYRVAQKSRLI